MFRFINAHTHARIHARTRKVSHVPVACPCLRHLLRPSSPPTPPTLRCSPSQPLTAQARGARAGRATRGAAAAQWYLRAAEQGDAMAQFRLALCYASGKVPPCLPVRRCVRAHEFACARTKSRAVCAYGYVFARRRSTGGLRRGRGAAAGD